MKLTLPLVVVIVFSAIVGSTISTTLVEEPLTTVGTVVVKMALPLVTVMVLRA